jgi:hypothetical protein
MITKKRLVEELNNILDTEEDITSYFYTYTINSLKYYDWLSEDKRKKITEITTKLKDDCRKHKTIIEKLIQRIEESKKNVF